MVLGRIEICTTPAAKAAAIAKRTGEGFHATYDSDLDDLLVSEDGQVKQDYTGQTVTVLVFEK
jgi:hypothetical protein